MSDWVADGYVTKAKGYRGAPYPEKRERRDLTRLRTAGQGSDFERRLPQLQFAEDHPLEGRQPSPRLDAGSHRRPAGRSHRQRLPGQRSPTKTAKKKSAEEAERERQIRAELGRARAQLQQGSRRPPAAWHPSSATCRQTTSATSSTRRWPRTGGAAGQKPIPRYGRGGRAVQVGRRQAADHALVKRGFTTPMDWRQLFGMADASYGGTQAQGAPTPEGCHDALEVAVKPDHQHPADHPAGHQEREGRPARYPGAEQSSTATCRPRPSAPRNRTSSNGSRRRIATPMPWHG